MAQSTVTLTAAPQTATLPDGQTVPMWGYTCGCATPARRHLHGHERRPRRRRTNWQPPLITVPAAQTLTITLTNNLSFRR